MGKLSKVRGGNYEYRVRNFFLDRGGWDDTIRIPLSGASDIISERIGKRDVLAIHRTGKRLVCECKKTGKKDKITIEAEWLNKLDFFDDDILVFAYDRSLHYVILDYQYYRQIKSEDWPNKFERTLEAKGEKTFVLNRAEIDKVNFLLLKWPTLESSYVIFPFERYIKYIEEENLIQ